ncbi:MAG: FkbM family methyltransferase [Planctomycetota bacterium]
MLQTLHKIVLSNSVTRRMQRRMIRAVKEKLGYSDPFFDLQQIIEATDPIAILDIGSHVGKTIARILEFNHTRPIHGFEPTSDSYQRLSARFAEHNLVSVHNLALSDQTGTATIHCNQNEQTNSLLGNDHGNRTVLAEATREVGSIEVHTETLDEWLAANVPNGKIVIKCDVQGADGLVLTGGKSAFSDRVVAFYSEAQIAPMYQGQQSFHELHHRLINDFDFSLANIYPCFRDQHGRALQTDALWIHNDHFGDR